MAVAVAVGKGILPGVRDFSCLTRPTPGSGGEERSDEAPEPGVGTWFAGPLRFNKAASVMEESCSQGSAARMGPKATARRSRRFL